MRRNWPVAAVLLVCSLLCGAAVWRLVTAGSAQPLAAVNRVVVVGVPGLGWDDLDRGLTPHLLDLTDDAALGSLTTRGATSLACPRDGWVTLGAGQRALYASSGGDCDLDGFGVNDAADVARANEQQPYGAQPGLLGTSVACTTLFGRDAALAVIGADVVVEAEQNLPTDPTDWASAWDSCPLALVAGPVLRSGPTRADALIRADVLVGRVAAAVMEDPDTLLIVAGISDEPDGSPQLHLVLAAAGSDLGDGAVRLLRSASTARVPYVQLIDIAPTVLASLGITAPTSMAGRPMVVAGNASADQAVVDLVTTARGARAHQSVTIPLIVAWIVLTAIFCMGAFLVLRRRDGRGPRRLWSAGVAVAAIPIGGMLANLVPWQASDHPELWFTVAVVATTAGLTAAVLCGRLRAYRLGPPLALVSIGAVVLGLDIATGSRLQLLGLLGYNPIVAGRFTGLGNMPFGLFATCGLLTLAATLHGRSSGQVRTLMGVAGSTMVLLVGVPGLGSDIGGVLALVPALLIMAMLVSGRRPSPTALLAAFSAGVIIVVVLAVMDHTRAVEDQTHLGRFVGQVLDGSAATVIERKAAASLDVLMNSPVSALAPVLLGMLGWLLYRPDSLGRALVRAAGPAGTGALAGVALAALLGSLLNDSGIAVFVAAAAVAVPLLLSIALRERFDPAVGLRRDRATPGPPGVVTRSEATTGR